MIGSRQEAPRQGFLFGDGPDGGINLGFLP